ncbi:MAG TPA: TatD family hydrolase [Gemmatimonadales bacterium]|nr:TatD family hydrolase [Gemmatimonadales bacterium]
MLVDTHCHLADAAFEADAGEVVARARAAGVGHVVVIGETPEAADRARALAAAHPSCSTTAGLHPHEASRWSPDLEADLRARLRDPGVVAAGETGLDYHYEHSPRARQREAFAAQLALAAAAGKPAVVHAREADADVAAELRNQPGAVAILHSFSSAGLLRAALDAGHYVSFSGMVTFRSWALDDALRAVPADRLLLETDAPYLAPVPHRGRRNEPAYVADTARRVAEVRGVGLPELVAQTTANAVRVFGARVAC